MHTVGKGHQRSQELRELDSGNRWLGKTALATWCALRSYDRREFDYIVSITAKDRELTASGISALDPDLTSGATSSDDSHPILAACPPLPSRLRLMTGTKCLSRSTSFHSLLDAIAETLQFPEIRNKDIASKEAEIRTLISHTKGLLFVDNLETLDDTRLVRFLDDLPQDVRAITTSRRTTVRVSVHPVDLGPLLCQEVGEYIDSLAAMSGLGFIRDLSHSEKQQIGDACDCLPIAVRWVLSRSRSARKAMRLSVEIKQSNSKGEEVLEFGFRRIFDSMTGHERDILRVLSLFSSYLPCEALHVGSRVPVHLVLDTTENLISDGLIHRLFDPQFNDYSFSLKPILRTFVSREFEADQESKIRKRLSDYFEAKDIKNLENRIVVRAIRQGKTEPEASLLDLAMAADRRGDLYGAEDLYKQALARNPRSWRAARLAAEFYRHNLVDVREALRLYEQAAANAPGRGSDRALIFREWGILLRDSGQPFATDGDREAGNSLARDTGRCGGYRGIGSHAIAERRLSNRHRPS